VTWLVGARTGKGSLTVDHIDNDGRNNAAENLVPSCHGCNSKRQKTDLVGDGELFITMKGQRGRHRAVERACRSCGATFLHLAAATQPNKGQFCSKSCRAKALNRLR